MWIMPDEESARLLERARQGKDVEKDILEFCIRMREMDEWIPNKFEFIKCIKGIDNAYQFLMKVGYSEHLYLNVLKDMDRWAYKMDKCGWKDKLLKMYEDRCFLTQMRKITKDKKIQFRW